MTILHPSSIAGQVHGLLVNSSGNTLESSELDSVAVSYAGFAGDVHTSLERKSCVRVRKQYAIGTPIRNTRQISIVSTEELQAVAAAMGIDSIRAEWLGANLVLAGIPNLTRVPPASRLLFAGGVSLVVDTENGPCKGPADIIEQHYPGYGKLFVKAALQQRGLTAWVEREGEISQGESVALHLPQRYEYP